MNSTSDRILHLLKRNGAQTADMLGEALEMTSMGVRRHLDTLSENGVIENYDQIEGVGRPRKFWQLTPKGHGRFPDAHADLTVKMIGDIRRVFGEEGLDRLIAERERDMRLLYEGATRKALLAERVEALAELRARDGYMARVERDGDDLLLIEDHCPICAAATACQGFCRSELSIFRMVLGPDAVVERDEYLLDGGRRCSYRISARAASGS
ncbi:putative transcriptional regulator [Parvibaculum lavamentivorans DS-1]|uniref:Putative transcriptional regulator n=1 Tax=Parvibaculum lavamentivorans (strain DS-1 / DSM 13023 / NCIMB 13966) TaxID=402881 RepID=A7HTU7_PARL1|nr:metalloregulator ArsR/SmtB family transcription factor [Parvibaculum lavamentivorans]ABS63330.1 putative transcriptional regulator [Parvibaculum lavamentivorans DS-1]